MTLQHDHSNDPSAASMGSRPEELPPVSPPSAGFIVQLFLIPALIVLAVVAVWALFGKLAHAENDWTQLTTAISSSNELRRWPAAEQLANLLRNEQLSPPTDGELLSRNPIVVEALTKLLTDALASASNEDEDIRHQEFLARTLGALDADPKTLPVLAEAMNDSHDIVVRKSALMAVALIAGRHFDDATGYTTAVSSGADTLPLAERNLPLTVATISDPAIIKQLQRSAQDPDPVIRHLAGYTLASVSGPDSLQQLRVMLTDGNHMAQANAAIGLARNGSIDGVPTMIELMANSLKSFRSNTDTTPNKAASPEEIRQAEVLHWIEESKVASNCLKAVTDLWPQIDSEHRDALRRIVRQMEKEFPNSQIQQKASDTLKTIGQP